MFQFSRFQLATAFLALILLRLSVGFHFFNEGITKIRAGDFTAKYFLGDAKGPLAPYFKQMLDDPEGKVKLCITESTGPTGETVFAIDPEFTFLIWNDFIDRASNYYGFGSPDLQRQIADRREKLAEKIVAGRVDPGLEIDTRKLELQRDLDEQSILALRRQPGRLEEILTGSSGTTRRFPGGESDRDRVTFQHRQSHHRIPTRRTESPPGSLVRGFLAKPESTKFGPIGQSNSTNGRARWLRFGIPWRHKSIRWLWMPRPNGLI